MENKIKKLQVEHGMMMNKDIQTQLNAAKKAWETIEIQEIEKNLMFCRQTYYDNSPKALKILAIKLKKQREKTTIATIID